MKALQAATEDEVKKVLAEFDQYTSCTGEQMDPEARVVLARAAEEDTTFFSFWKGGVRAEAY
ncbi:translationally-controlled tumor protein [Streptomyces sp. NBC_00247]|uniref:hypothetical protein n=1 Tax=Streptomyces sp. NBC_00247 TaxID=2975689 RepID=UPI002E2E3BE7|nr:hypothetical protein [Streptomyces sp. NBC_00247]